MNPRPGPARRKTSTPAWGELNRTSPGRYSPSAILIGSLISTSRQNYPSRPLRLIIGYTPGGSADLTARLIGQWLSERLGQQFVVESRPGAGTNLATEPVLRA